MKKAISTWSVAKLRDQFSQINFPEYQREPNLWSLLDKQRLIDSIVRQFDMSSLYFYQHKDGLLDCVDGRQRIGTIMAFLGLNPEDQHDRFRLQLLNEYSDDEHSESYLAFNGLTFENIREESPKNAEASSFVQTLLEYRLSVVE